MVLAVFWNYKQHVKFNNENSNIAIPLATRKNISISIATIMQYCNINNNPAVRPHCPAVTLGSKLQRSTTPLALSE